ncbi:MAG: hypothetical protein JW894_04070 [Bacteroidales bacterium]|nr:hypothetical protein [Bacteroidales bacterium]
MKISRSIILFFLITVYYAHAEAKYTQEYRNDEITINVNSDKTYAIAVMDQREVVLDHSQGIDFVGYLRSATWIAYPIGTASKNPFSQDVTYTIAGAIERSGANITRIQTDIDQTQEEVLKKLQESDADVLLLVTVNKWRSDTKSVGAKMTTEMTWDLTLNIYDKNGNSSTENNVEGIEGDLKPALSSTRSKRQAVIDKYYKEKLEELFSSGDVTEKLN